MQVIQQWLISFIMAWTSLVGLDTQTATVFSPQMTQAPIQQEYDATLNFPSDRYPETAQHIKEAIEKGQPEICTIDRDGADENRSESLKGIPTKDGYDRDEWPMAMCAEGGFGADIKYIDPSDNRGSGSWVGNHLEDYPDGTRIKFILEP